MKKILFLLAIVIILIIGFSLDVFSLGLPDESECIQGNGIWVTPSLAQGDDPSRNQKSLIPYCSCKKGYYWESDLKICLNDSELRCSQTHGKWVNNSCICPEGTIQWTEGFGCDLPGPEPKNIQKPADNKGGKGYSLFTPLSILLLVLTLIILIIFFKGRKHNYEKTK